MKINRGIGVMEAILLLLVFALGGIGAVTEFYNPVSSGADVRSGTVVSVSEAGGQKIVALDDGTAYVLSWVCPAAPGERIRIRPSGAVWVCAD